MSTVGGVSSKSPQPYLYSAPTDRAALPFKQNTIFIDQTTGKNLLETMYGHTSTDLSAAQLVAIICNEINKTRDGISMAQALLLKIRANRIAERYQDNIAKLKDVAKSQDEAMKAKRDMEIVKWTLFAVSLLIDIASLGSAAGATAAISSVVSLTTSLLQVIPVTKDGDTVMDKAQDGLTTGFKKMQVEIVKDLYKEKAKEEGYDLDAMTDDEIIQYLQDYHSGDVNVNDANSYSAMTTLLAIQLTLAVVIAAVGYLLRDKSAGEAGAKQVASGVANAAKTGARLVADAAEKGAKEAAIAAARAAKDVANRAKTAGVKNLLKEMLKGLDKGDDLRRLSDRAAKGARIIEGVGTIGQGAGQIYTAKLQQEASKDAIEAQYIAATIRVMLKMLAADEELLKEILATRVTSSEAIQNIIRNEHAMNKKVSKAVVYA